MMALARKLFTEQKWATITAFFVVAVCLLARGVAPLFIYDAQVYWAGSMALVSGGDVTVNGALDLRGVLSSLIYIPATLATTLFGSGVAGLSVLIQNAFMIAAFGTLLLPHLAARLVPVDARHIWLSGVLTAVTLSGFAPYPLMDAWALGALLLGILLLTFREWWTLLLGGAAFAVCIDLRPAYLAPVLLIILIWLVWNWRSAAWTAAGIVVGFIPQVIYNLRHFGLWSIFAPDTFEIAGIQTASASFLVRYDTVAFVDSPDPRLSYCSPDMAAIVLHDTPNSLTQILTTFAAHPFDALVFAAQKVSASVAWGPETPYSALPGSWIGWFAVLAIIISAVGIVAIVAHTFREGLMAADRTGLQILALWLGTAATIIVSSPEARFGMPLLVIGIVGCIILLGQKGESRRVKKPVIFALASILLALGVAGLAGAGLANPAPPGGSSPSLCTSLDK